MKTMQVLLQDVTQTKRQDDVTSFVGADKSGSFGILPDHDRFMTALEIGLCRFKTADHGWLYVATAGALLYFHDNRLYLTTRHFLIDNDYERISSALADQLIAEETRLREQKESLRQMEEEVLKRLWELRRSGGSYRRDEV